MGDTSTIHAGSQGYGNADPLMSGSAPAERPKLTWAQCWAKFPTNAMLWPCLIFLTAVGAFLRFWRLDRQAYWTDEGHTVERMEGSFQNMLSNISGQGFPPGWYALLRWWREWEAYHLGSEGASWSMGSLRMLPAILGMLTVPGMYFLARQFTDRKGALLVMLLAAVNPYLIYYSRDIKMYAPLWFFVVISTALLLQWLTTQRHWLWFPLYVAAAAAMTAMHATGWIIVGLHFLFVVTRPRVKPLDAPLWLLGGALASWMPAWWFLIYLRPEQWSSRIDAGQNNPAMQWFERFTNMSWQTVAGLPTIHVFGYLWPTYPATNGDPGISPDDWGRVSDWFALGGDFESHLATRSFAWMAHWQVRAAWILFGILVAGLVPWRRILGGRLFFGRKAARDGERVPLLAKAVPLVGADSATRGRWWWVAVWIAVPTAVFVFTWMDGTSWYDWILTKATAWGLLAEGKAPKRLWEPRYLGVIVPAWLLWLGASLRRLPFVVVRAVAIVFVVGVCVVSALSNHLTYRNAPFNRTIEIAMARGKLESGTVAVAVPSVAFQNPAETVSLMGARKVAPGSAEERAFPVGQVRTLRSEAEAASWVRSQANSRVKTIVLTDRFGDVTEAGAAISDESLGKALGRRWKLTYEESYKWQYEWRFYIFHTWRTRVWQLVENGTAAER